MIDTNLINSVLADGHQVGSAVQLNWPAISAGAVIVARELANFNRWLAGAAGFIISHGGVAMIARKLIWNPPIQKSINPVIPPIA